MRTQGQRGARISNNGGIDRGLDEEDATRDDPDALEAGFATAAGRDAVDVGADDLFFMSKANIQDTVDTNWR